MRLREAWHQTSLAFPYDAHAHCPVTESIIEHFRRFCWCYFGVYLLKYFPNSFSNDGLPLTGKFWLIVFDAGLRSVFVIRSTPLIANQSPPTRTFKTDDVIVSNILSAMRLNTPSLISFWSLFNPILIQQPYVMVINYFVLITITIMYEDRQNILVHITRTSR